MTAAVPSRIAGGLNKLSAKSTVKLAKMASFRKTAN